jgi:hypothetical protein
MRNTNEAYDGSNAPCAVADRLVERVRGEYLEMPGLQLTTSQAQRLWGLDEETCSALLTALIEQHFLLRTAAGTHVRRD